MMWSDQACVLQLEKRVHFKETPCATAREVHTLQLERSPHTLHLEEACVPQGPSVAKSKKERYIK